MNKVSRQHIKLTFFTLALLFVGSAAVAQSDSPYVIKRTKYDPSTGDHYLAHVYNETSHKWELTDATEFTPDCIWYSGRDFNVMGTHHNYYFIDDQNHYHFLSAPLQAGGSLSLSESLPEVYLLNNTDHNYYFYDWDQEQGNKPYGGGVARGHQYNGVTSETCSFDWRDNQCWEVYWVECDGSSWKLSSNYSYDITANSGRYRPVTVTSFPLVVSGTGGLDNLSDFDMEYSTSITALELSASITPFNYIPAYKKYEFDEVTVPGATPTTVHHTYYYPYGASNTSAPANTVSSGSNTSLWTYAWSISGPGAQYLSFSATGDFTHASSLASPTLYYRTPNNDGHKTATLTLTVTYPDGSTQTKSCTVTVKTPCQNPQFSANVSYENVIVSWTQTAASYKVSYKKASDSDWTEVSVGNVTSHTIIGLAHSTTYDYKVQATSCTTPEPTSSQFTTLAEPDAMIRGAVFGGGRMANVSGKTEVIIINTDSIGAVYGGNDIAGEVQGASNIILGVAASSETTSYSYLYNGGEASDKVRVFDVYGGGNGYYLYNATVFHGATTANVNIPNNATVDDLDGHMVWKNETGADYALTIPKINKTTIEMAANDHVKVDSIFGGAKNAFITNAVANANGTSITVKGGTAFAVYGGNNYGGNQTAGKHYIKVEGTTVETSVSNYNSKTIGRDFGIGYVFGGGNKVAGLTTNVEITGGMCDTVFGGGNAADVSASNVTINCVGPSKTFTNAVNTWSGDNINEINGSYAWNGTGIYNVRTLFGGNNRADMGIEEQVVGLPNITLTSGSVGTVYGGGNAGNMLSKTPDDADPTTNPGTGPIATDFDSPMVGTIAQPIYYGTHVVMDHANMIVDYLYGGCQMSDVDYSTWVEIKDGHVGTVYGGCNVSGDVGSEPRIEYPYYTTGEEKQLVKGGTYVKATGGTIHGDLFAGSNGYYHCNDGIYYIEGHNYTSYNYISKKIPTHNETHVKVSKDDDAVPATYATVKGNVYAGGNMAYVGFIVETIPNYRFREFVGFCSVRMDGGVVEGSVYGGGNRASVFGSNEVKVSGGSIGYTSAGVSTGGALYGGNDRAGQVAQITNRVLPSSYGVASDGHTNLRLLGVKTYVGVTGKPKVGTVYGGGNGAYSDYNSGNYCDPTDKPVQSNTFVDININADGGSSTGGYINTVYGGGNGVTVLDRITVFVNVQNVPTGSNAYDQIGTIFGGNNQGDLDILSDLIMLHGQVNTVYGGCNSGAMTGSHSYEGYTNIGSAVRLLNQYQPNGTGTPVVPTAKVTGAVYGGCRMNNVTNNSLVLVEAGTHPASMFGGCDISGTVSGTSWVVVKNGTSASPNNSTVIDKAYGGGNGDYDYETTYAGLTPPSSTNSRVDMLSGTANNLYGGGNACGSGTTLVNVSNGTVNTGVYGGSNAKGTITGDVEVNITGGTIGASTSARANVHGGGYGHETHTSGHVTVNIASLNATTGPTINGDIYGGSALGQVSASGLLTQVNFYKGTINGDVYGGGLGNDDHAAEVSGNVEVNIRGGVFNDAAGVANTNDGDPSDGNTGGGCIYGCNNNNGSPKGNVNVNIYATDHGDTPATNLYPNTSITTVDQLNTNAATQTYAIKAVFGGGNLAAYVPDEVTSGDPHSATVHVYYCDNTIEDIFGGGNAAEIGSGDVSQDEITLRTDTYVIIEGGRIHRVIGGGNGEDTSLPAANIFGTANTTVYAGLINEVYGGANRKGSVDAINLTMSNPGSSSSHCSHQVYGKVFGCANAAPYNRSVTTNILCDVGIIGELYGGSNQANIGISGETNADVTLNLYGGNHQKVFAGSKGIAAATGVAPVEANIYGNVTLNLFGGTIGNAFGGSDANGNIEGVITVNVIDKEDCHPLDVTNIYGASNKTAYNPRDVSAGVKPVSPVVNVVHVGIIADDPTTTEIDESTLGIRGNVYGGGNEATVTANPKVNIGYHHASMAQYMPLDANGDSLYHVPSTPRAYVTGDVFGGGNQAAVTGTDTVNIRRSNSYVDNVFGGGNQAGTTKTVVNVHEGTVATAIYGGCNTNGTVTDDIKVNIYGGTLGTSPTSRIGIFGGGQGHATATDGNVTVTIGEGTTPTIYADVYGGSAFGEVGAADKLAKVWLKNGTVYGTIFGGGMGDGSYAATVSGATEVAIEGGLVRGTVISGSGSNAVTGAVFGGCNVNGIVMGNATVSYTGGAIGVTDNHANTYGGGLGENTKVKGNVAVTVNHATGDVYGDVYGGSAKGKVNTQNGTEQSGYSKTQVTLTNGTIHGSLYGGGHGLEDHAANVYGPVTVTVEGGTVTNVFGCNNVKGAPMDSVVLNVTAGVIDSIFGGGNVAAYVAPLDARDYPEINISGGNIIYKVVGGGNNIANNLGINGNPHVNISGGTVCTVETGLKAGVYGGCNTQGRVTGNIFVNITGTNSSQTTIGTQAALNYAQEHTLTSVSVHGGGYGDGTSTDGNVTVNFGSGGELGTDCEYPMLYGDLYGGSALGTVNSASAIPANTTTVTVMNGSFKYNRVGYNQYGGNIYGGGRGQVGDLNVAKGQVNGVVHVNIGSGTIDPTTGYTVNIKGKANVKGCNVFGCNNTNGSPQQDVYVDVYQTKHVETDSVSYVGNNSDYAIRNVYGGGNRAHYSPTGIQKVHNTVHACENTIENVYGGGNAADTYGTVVSVDGGRFKYIFGGGNGQSTPANILDGGVNISVYGGQVGWYFSGCNLHGTIGGGNPIEQYGCTSTYCPCGDELDVENYYFGANEAVTVGGLSHIINCGDNMKFKNVYGGSRLAAVYGDIKLWVRGGEIENLFAGNEGSDEVQADIKKYPAADYNWTTNPDGHPTEVRTYLDAQHALGHDLYGEGGNVILILEGGHLGNVYGGNDYRGNVEGDITIVVDSTQAYPCELIIDYLYGGNKKSSYTPDSCLVSGQNEVCLDPTRVSPQVYLKNGSVTYDVYGGSEGGDPSHQYGNGFVVSNPQVVIGDVDPLHPNHKARVGRDVFGGGSAANMIGNPTVVVQGKATVEGSVYGGGREGDIDGSTDVKIAPTTPVTTEPTPTPPSHRLTVSAVGNGTVEVKYYDRDGVEQDVSSGGDVPEGSILHIKATPNSGSSFSLWSTDFGNIEQPTHAITRCLMGPRDTTLTATFVTP